MASNFSSRAIDPFPESQKTKKLTFTPKNKRHKKPVVLYLLSKNMILLLKFQC